MGKTSTKQTKKIDNLGRITIPKSIRDEVGYGSNDTMEFFRCEDTDGIFIGMRKIGENIITDEDIAIRVLTNLGCEIPEALKNYND